MARHVRIRLLVLTAVAVIAGAVWFAGSHQRTTADLAFEELESAERMLTAMLDQESGLAGYVNTRQESFLRRYETGRGDLAVALADSRAIVQDGEVEEVESLDGQAEAARRFNAEAEPLIAAVRIEGVRALPPGAAATLDAELSRFRKFNEALQADRRDERDANQRSAGLLTVLLIVALSATFGGGGYLLFERRVRRDESRRERHSDFVDVLQLARSEAEAHQVVKRHLERIVGGGHATVLNRNNSANRLEAGTGVEDESLLEALEGAEPAACVAIRGAKTYQRDAGEEELMSCEVCGASGASVTCVPSLVGGEVIGSVLVEHSRRLGNGDTAYLASSIAEAAPILANLRNLAIAELRAATDALTGLPNNRSLHENLKRMSAQAGRTASPLAAVLFDLDHFKQVNDTHGHGKGDEVLAAVGDAVTNTVRASDLVGRYGGEEFLALLPGTDRAGAVAIAEKLREAIEAIEVPGVTRTVTASFGVAVLPDEAGEPELLLRIADRAMYTAKANGRNRVEMVADQNGSAAAATVPLGNPA